jgi:hypothetical protein
VLAGLESGKVRNVGVERALPEPKNSKSRDGSIAPLFEKLVGLFIMSKARYVSNDRPFISAIWPWSDSALK